MGADALVVDDHAAAARHASARVENFGGFNALAIFSEICSVAYYYLPRGKEDYDADTVVDRL